MNKIFYLAIVMALLCGSVTPAAARPAAEPDAPDAPLQVLGDQKLYLPMVTKISHAYFTVQGRITNGQPGLTFGNPDANTDQPIANVIIRDQHGNQTATDSQGRFSLVVRRGSRLTPDLPGYYFTPTYFDLTAGGNFNNLNFTGMYTQDAALDPAAPDANVLLNSDFEIVPYYWNPISGEAAGYTPSYTNATAHSGVISGVTGIYYPWSYWVPSWSRWRSHEVYIPVGTGTVAEVSFWINGVSEEGSAAFTLADPAVEADAAGEDAFQAAPAELQALIGHSTDEADLAETAAIVGDFQYVAVIDAWTNDLLYYLWAQRRATNVWEGYGPLAIPSIFQGTTIKLEFGTFNDGDLLDTLAYFDDVELNLDTLAVTCTNILLDPTMELNDGSWTWNSPQNIPPVWSTEYFWSAGHSMKAGLAPWDVSPIPANWDATTEFYQPFTIPANATYAVLNTLLKPRSTDWWGWWADEEAMNLADADLAPADALAPDQMYSQYAHITGPTGGNGLYMLFKWFSVDSAFWHARSYDLLALRGQSLAVQFGVGHAPQQQPWLTGVKNALYVDDTYLNVCTPDAVIDP